jgi:hypothetical protein
VIKFHLQREKKANIFLQQEKEKKEKKILYAFPKVLPKFALPCTPHPPCLFVFYDDDGKRKRFVFRLLFLGGSLSPSLFCFVDLQWGHQLRII